MATQCRPRSRRTRHSETAVAAPRPGRTASRPHDPDSPLHDKPRHSCGNPIGERHDPWPARQRSLVGEPPAAASPQPGSAPNWRSQPDHPAGRSSRRRWPVSHRQRRFSPTSPSKPRAHPRSEIRRETTASTPAPPISRQSRHQAPPSAAIPSATRLEPWAAPPKLQTADGERRKRTLYVAIDRRSRSVHLAIKDDETEASAIAFLREAAAALPFRMSHVLTDNGSCFTQAFAKACAELGADYRHTKPRTPQTNGMVERFNGRIGSEVLAITVYSHQQLEQLLRGFNAAYNARRQRVLEAKTPDQVVAERLAAKPALAKDKPSGRAGPCDIIKARLIAENAKEVSQPDKSSGPKPCLGPTIPRSPSPSATWATCSATGIGLRTRGRATREPRRSSPP